MHKKPSGGHTHETIKVLFLTAVSTTIRFQMAPLSQVLLFNINSNKINQIKSQKCLTQCPPVLLPICLLLIILFILHNFSLYTLCNYSLINVYGYFVKKDFGGEWGIGCQPLTSQNDGAMGSPSGLLATVHRLPLATRALHFRPQQLHSNVTRLLLFCLHRPAQNYGPANAQNSPARSGRISGTPSRTRILFIEHYQTQSEPKELLVRSV